jgi:succinate dehydrogenase / fumarate reductase membrane anchor subunit
VAFVGSPWVAIPLALAVISVCVHFKLGVQVVVEDYIHSDALRIVLLVLNTFFAAAVGAVALFSIVRIMLASLGQPV